MKTKKLIDYHAHLADKKLDNILDEIINNANLNNIGIINVGTGNIDNKETLEISKRYALYSCIGIHPSEVDNTTIDDLEKLIIANRKNIVGIGECGLDLYWRQDNLDKQLFILEQQIKLSIKYDLPLVIHARSAYNEVYNLLINYKGKIKGVLHCFDGQLKIAQKIVNELGFYIGISGIVTFKNANNVVNVAKNIDLSNLLVETDSPYLAPSPYRGKINQPMYVECSAKKIAELKNMNEEEVFKILKENTLKLFKIGG